MNNLSNERVELIIGRLEHAANNVKWSDASVAQELLQAAAGLRELLAYREAQGEPVAWAHRLINKRSEAVHNWVYGSTERSQSEGDIFKVEVMPLFAAPPLPAVPQTLLRELVDVAWQSAKESTEVPPTSHADKLIFQVFGNSEQVNSPVIPDDWAVVPIKPTEAMRDAWFFMEDFDSEWAAMLAAAPNPEV